MNILVTGGAGYVGSVCAAELVKQRHHVVVYDDLSAGHRMAVPQRAQFVKGDVADSALLLRTFKKFKIGAIMHFAAKALVDESIRDPAVFYQNNVSATLALLDVALECKIKKLIFSSSAAVYGEPQVVPIPEDHPKQPVNAYGETKLVIEVALGWYARAYGLQFAAMRYFNAAGATKLQGEDHRPETHLLPRLLDAALDPAKVFYLYGDDYPTPDGACIRDFVHVLDIAQAHILALRLLDKVKTAVYNVGLGEGYSIRQTIKAVEDVTQRRISVQTGPRRPGDPARLVASAAKLSKDLGWKPRHSSLANIVASAWRWKQQRPKGYSYEAAL